jgi:hydroxypyruvate reductase
MTEVTEKYYRDELGVPIGAMGGLAVTRYGYGRPTKTIPVIEAAHPVPDSAGLAAAEKTLAIADAAGADDLVLVLISGGASANWTAPANGLSLAEKREVTQALLRSGARIDEINTVRKHLSRIKGGRLAVRCSPARVVTLAISDVPGDDPAVIGSGPTVPDPSTLADARAIIARHQLELSAAATRALSDPRNETPKPGDAAFGKSSFRIVARPRDAFRAVEQQARSAGYECVFLGDRIEGEARLVAAEHAEFARKIQKQGRRTVILSGGELTVTLRGQGRGGPNQEYALALAIALDGQPGIAALAADTDGTDGGGGQAQDPAGAFVDDATATRARELGLDPAAFLNNNDSTEFFSALDDLIAPGPTYTNVNDFRAILIDSP